MVGSIKGRLWYVFPAIGTVLSFPALLGIVAADILIIYAAITGQAQILFSLQHSFSPLVFVLLGCYAVFGPFLACILCAAARSASSGSQGSEIGIPTGHELLWNRIVLLMAALALGLVLVTGLIFGIARQGT
ncbi:MAG TPA: hypothetical protein VH593_32375 [Ktedonobacteraceae bacterium]|jgi:hypothetical protein